VEESWEPTRHGGLRRAGVAQDAQSAAQITRRAGGRIFPPAPIFRWAEKLGLPQCPYVIRWMIEFPFGSLRVHHWLKPDDDRAFHDHPWWFITLVVRGGYTDRQPVGDGVIANDVLRAGSVRYRPALHRHTVVPGPRGAWTVMVTGPKSRPWGFWRDGKFFKANKWFARFGHHPCSGA
jgi:hypothetical protein